MAPAWLGWTLDDTQEKTGFDRNTISRYKRGAVKLSRKTLEMLAATREMRST
jgi:hypothetical protein